MRERFWRATSGDKSDIRMWRWTVAFWVAVLVVAITLSAVWHVSP
jgi:hypothetical protein